MSFTALLILWKKPSFCEGVIMPLRSFILLSIWLIVTLGCAENSDNSEGDAITLCTTHEDMDQALDRATQLWNDRQNIAPIPLRKPPGLWLHFQSIANHEVGHIVMRGSGDEHVAEPGAIMHVACFRCYRLALTSADEALLARERKKGDVRTVVYLGVQDDTSMCDYEAEWVDDEGKVARIRGNKMQFQRQKCLDNGVCWEWLMPGKKS